MDRRFRPVKELPRKQQETRLIKGVASRQRESKRDQRHLTGTEPRNGGGLIRSIGVTGHLRVYRQLAARRVFLNNERPANGHQTRREKRIHAFSTT